MDDFSGNLMPDHELHSLMMEARRDAVFISDYWESKGCPWFQRAKTLEGLLMWVFANSKDPSKVYDQFLNRLKTDKGSFIKIVDSLKNKGDVHE